MTGPKFFQVWFELTRKTDLSPGAKLLYSRLKLLAGETGRCYARDKELAEELGCNFRQVRRWRVELRGHGLLDWQKRRDNDGNDYELHLVAECRPGVDNLSQPQVQRCEQIVPTVRTNCPNRCGQIVPTTIYELREELEEAGQPRESSVVVAEPNPVTEAAAGPSKNKKNQNENQNSPEEAIRELLVSVWAFADPPSDKLIGHIAAALGSVPLDHFRACLGEASDRAKSYGLALKIARDAAATWNPDEQPPRRQPGRETPRQSVARALGTRIMTKKELYEYLS